MTYDDSVEIHGMTLKVHKFTAAELKALEVAQAEHDLYKVEKRLQLINDENEKSELERLLERQHAKAKTKADDLEAEYEEKPTKKNEKALIDATLEAEEKRILLADAQQAEKIRKELEEDKLSQQLHLAYCHLFATVAEGDKEQFMDNAPYDLSVQPVIGEALRLGKFYLPSWYSQRAFRQRSEAESAMMWMQEVLARLQNDGKSSDSTPTLPE